MSLHPDILYSRGDGQLVVTEEELWKRAMYWVAKRASELCPDGRPRRSALVRAVRESGLRLTEAQIENIWQANQRELDDTSKCPIVVASERECQEEIKKARQRGDILLGRF